MENATRAVAKNYMDSIAHTASQRLAFHHRLCYDTHLMPFQELKQLQTELDAWKRAGLTAELWWRDDDAGEPCPALDTLFRISGEHAVPCGLATIPTRAGEPLRKDVSNAPYIWILQHGYAHINHAPRGNGAWELGLHRPTSEVLEELRKGMVKLNQLFKERFVPAVVPPWNKMAPELLPYLPVMGYRGVSASYKRHRPVPPGDLRVADAHCDLLSWKDKKNGARFAGSEKCVNHLVDHLHDKRIGVVALEEPTCILTHHLEMDDEAWIFLDALLSVTVVHPAVNWLSPADIWPAA